MWVIKTKGQTFYIDHLESKIGFSTKETPDNTHTKGSVKFKGQLRIFQEADKIHAMIE